LGANEQKLYRLIRQRTVASQMADAQLQLTSYLFQPKADPSQTWVSNGKVVLFDGYMKVGGGEQEDVILPVLTEGATVNAHEILAAQHFTKPPARYSEASLVKALESR
jgi:DNA topoisomerase-1